ncbi:hypothetical protein GCM10009815_38990 [Nocardioides marmoribigeumensis]
MRYFRSRATLVCFAFARPRPIASDPLAHMAGVMQRPRSFVTTEHVAEIHASGLTIDLSRAGKATWLLVNPAPRPAQKAALRHETCTSPGPGPGLSPVG